MRRIFACLAVVALLGAAAGPSAAGIRTERRAHAFFVLPERGGVRPFVFVTVGEITASYEGFGIGRGICPGEIPESCAIDRRSAFAGTVRPDDVFEVDPALGSAYLKVTRRGITHEVTWTAVGAPAPVVTESECGPAPAGPKGAGAARTASASGTVLGKKVATAEGNPGFASLEADVYGC